MATARHERLRVGCRHRTAGLTRLMPIMDPPPRCYWCGLSHYPMPLLPGPHHSFDVLRIQDEQRRIMLRSFEDSDVDEAYAQLQMTEDGETDRVTVRYVANALCSAGLSWFGYDNDDRVLQDTPDGFVFGLVNGQRFQVTITEVE